MHPSAAHHLRALRRGLADPAVASLEGRFHTHVTVDADPATLAPVCADTGARLTVIDLSGEKTQRDPMLTLDATGGVGVVEAGVSALLDALGARDIPMTRVKVEHGSLPTVAAFSARHYREAHLKLWLARPHHEARLAELRAAAPALGFALSRNPREQAADHVVQFVNMRMYQGGLAECDARVDAVVAWLVDRGMPPVDVRRETAVVDTAHGLDAWWA